MTKTYYDYQQRICHNIFVLILVVIIKDHSSSPDGVNRITGRVVSLKAVGASKADGVNNGEEAGRDMETRERTTRQDIISSKDTAMAIGAVGISSITTISIGASNNRVDRPLQLAAKL